MAASSLNTPVGGALNGPRTPSLSSSSLSSSPSPILSKFLKPIPPSLPTPKSSKGDKTTGARVLTSQQCLALFEEKERKKKEAAEEKERRT